MCQTDRVWLICKRQKSGHIKLFFQNFIPSFENNVDPDQLLSTKNVELKFKEQSDLGPKLS